MKKIIYVLLILMLLSITACTTPQKEEPPSPQETEVTLYYANKVYVETGDESLEKLVPIKRLIPTGEGLHMTMLNELKKAPDENDVSTELLPDITFLGVEIENNIARVNISSKNLNGGSLQEFFVMNQIIYTLTDLEDIDQVQFLVDGEIAESLMGHYSADKPLGRNEV